MKELFAGKAIAIFWCHSDVGLYPLCQKLQAQYDLPNFTLDEHSTWEYANLVGDSVAFNVTKTERLDTIATWMEGAPKGVNYQIILYMDTEGDGTVTALGDIDGGIQMVHQYLSEVLNKKIILYIPSDKQQG